jgi:hypothetical protein
MGGRYNLLKLENRGFHSREIFLNIVVALEFIVLIALVFFGNASGDMKRVIIPIISMLAGLILCYSHDIATFNSSYLIPGSKRNISGGN